MLFKSANPNITGLVLWNDAAETPGRPQIAGNAGTLAAPGE